jgi:hypothetical protein
VVTRPSTPQAEAQKRPPRRRRAHREEAALESALAGEAGGGAAIVKRSTAAIVTVLALYTPARIAGRQEAPAAPRLVTRWAAQVDRIHPLPEYPRPQMARERWENLNGEWDYAIAPRGAEKPGSYDGKIVVPFPVESTLSGVTKPVTPDQWLWYRRSFERPRLASGERLLLHFGAVDWETAVFVNGRAAGEHRGGYDPFTFDITDALTASGSQELVVRVWDPTDKGSQPRGKQVLNPRSIWYTAVTGIWQTVWLEPVPAIHIESLEIEPDVDRNVLSVKVNAAGPGAANATAHIEIRDGDRTVSEARGPLTPRPRMGIHAPKLWSPSNPFLYTLKVRLSTGDEVTSYAGMRKISVARGKDGINRLFLNNQPLFEFGPLDQGWWPDGLYTAPSDEALRYDVEMQKKMGFNTIRKHVKVEPARWYYDCDRLGMLVWQDMPSGNNDTPEGKQEFARELEHVVTALGNAPSIVMWVPFNEGWGQHDTPRYVEWLKTQDPTRLVNNASGWTDERVGDVADVHAYPGPGSAPPEQARASVNGEFGGLGLPLEGHTWLAKGNWGYRSFTSAEALGDAYRNLLHQLRLHIGEGASAAIYTQTTDVEIEVNGLMTYDREIVKMGLENLARWNATVYGPPMQVRTIVPSADTPRQSSGQGRPAAWRYTTSPPDASWTRTDFDDASWPEGAAGFGKTENRWAHVNTPWTTSDLWLRRKVDLPTGSFSEPYLRVFHDDDAEVYVNGELIAKLPGATSSYTYVALKDHPQALRAGANTIAVHVHQERGGQYIDVGMVDVMDR